MPTVFVDSASPALAKGDCVCLVSDASGMTVVTKATAAALSAAGFVYGIANAAATPGARVLVLTSGLISSGVTALAASNAGVVRCNGTTGRSERVATYSAGDYPLGVVDARGYLNFVPSQSVGLVGPLTGIKPFGATCKIMWLGDSNGQGSNSDEPFGFVGSWRQAVYQKLRQWRSDFDFIGSNISVQESNSFGLWYNDTFPGYKIEDLSAGFASYVASPGVGAPDLIIDLIGGNNVVAGDSLATMQAKRQALDAAYAANAPNATVIVMPIVPMVAGTTTAGNLSTWNTARIAYNTWLQGYVQSKPGYYWLDSSSQLALGEYQRDGIHLTRLGQASIGEVISTFLDQQVLGPRSGDVLPRAFKQRIYQSAILLSTNSADGLTCTSHGGFNPGSGSFAIALDYYPTEIPAVGSRCLIQFASYAGNPTAFYGLYQAGRNLSVYWCNQTGTIFSNGTGHAMPTTALTLNQWHRIVLMAHAPSNTIGLYINGKLIGLTQGVPSWSFSTNTFYVGLSPEFNGCLGYVSHIQAYKGSGIPRPGTMAGLLAAEGDYYQERPIASGLVSASFTLGNNLLDDINGNPAMVLVGGAAASGAYPDGAPIRPWEFQPDAPVGDLKLSAGGLPTLVITSGGLGSGGTATLEPGSTDYGGVIQLNTGTGPAASGLIEVDFSHQIAGASPIIMASLMDGSNSTWNAAANVIVQRVGANKLGTKMQLAWRNGGSNLAASTSDGWRLAWAVIQK